MRRGFLLDGKKRKQGPSAPTACMGDDVQRPAESPAPCGKVVAAKTVPAAPLSSSSSSSSPIIVPGPPVHVDEPEGSMVQQRRTLFTRMSADRNYCLRFFIPPDKSFVLAYWPNAQKSLPERLGASLTLSAASECRYQIRAVPGKGVGMFATEAIAPGAVISRERPILVTPLLLLWNSIGHISSSMPEHIRDAFFALHNCKPSSSAQLQDIINTNALHVDYMPGHTELGPYHGVFKDICRANHSCNPNAGYLWDLATFTGALRATRAIAAGEEVNISYLEAHILYAERQERLRDRWSFICKCPVCSLPPAARAENDVARQNLSMVLRSVVAGVYDKLAPDVLAQLRMTKLLEDAADRDVYLWRAVAGQLARTYCALGQRADAVKWARKAMEMTLVGTGTDGGWAAVVAAPEKTDVWRSQVK